MRATVGRLRTVTHVAVALLHTPAAVVTDAVAVAVTQAARRHPWGRLRPLLKVEGHAVQGQSAQTALKAPLS